MLTFPTRPGPRAGAHIGQPVQAEPCVGHQCVMADPGDTCLVCGHYTEDTIQATWSARARELTVRTAGRRRRTELVHQS